LDQCKIFLFITSSPAPSKRLQPNSAAEKRNPKERIVGVVVAQGIKWAMRVLPNDQAHESGISVALDQRKEGKEGKGEGEVVDSGDGVLCE
jgi:N-acetyltransferase